jgi:homocitrate synthase NifV
MLSDFVFIDKTLDYALKTRKIDAEKFDILIKKISEMGKIIFDVPIDCAGGNEVFKNVDMANVRLCIKPDADQLKIANGLRCTWVKVSGNSFSPACDVYSLKKVLHKANKLGIKVTLGCIDISEKCYEKIESIQSIINKFQVHSIVVHDFKSKLDPIFTFRYLESMKQIIKSNLEYGGKNELGLATGNALGAIKSGVAIVSTSIGGIGGFPAFEEVLMSMLHLFKIPVYIPKDIAHHCKDIMGTIGVSMANAKPIIGSDIFSHESGIHVDGIVKKSEIYEPFDPEEVGLNRKIVIGKHSGKAAILHKVNELNISIKPSLVSILLERVRSLAVEQKAALIDEQLKELAKEVIFHEGSCC